MTMMKNHWKCDCFPKFNYFSLCPCLIHTEKLVDLFFSFSNYEHRQTNNFTPKQDLLGGCYYQINLEFTDNNSYSKLKLHLIINALCGIVDKLALTVKLISFYFVSYFYQI